MSLELAYSCLKSDRSGILVTNIPDLPLLRPDQAKFSVKQTVY